MKTVRTAYYMNMTTQPAYTSNKFIRSINVDRDVWAEAQECAASRDQTMSGVIGLALKAYIKMVKEDDREDNN